MTEYTILVLSQFVNCYVKHVMLIKVSLSMSNSVKEYIQSVRIEKSFSIVLNVKISYPKLIII